MAQVPATNTPVSEYDASVYLVVGLTKALSSAPSEQLATYSMSLAWVETARGKSIVQHNPGNLSAGANWSGDYWRPPWFDSTDPKYAKLHQQMLDGTTPSAFRAYATPQAGWDAFAREVVRRKSLVAAMASDDTLGIVRALRETGYAPEYSDASAASFRSLAAEFRSRKLFSGLATATATVKAKPGSGVGAVAALFVLLAAVGAGAAMLLRRTRR
jgi:hypothetical protein